MDMELYREALSLMNDLIIPVVGVVVTWSEVREAHREKRIRNFEKAGELSPEERGELAAKALDFYREQYEAEIRQGRMTVRDLIYPTEWVQPADSDSFRLLSQVPVEISQDKWKMPPPHSSRLPYPNEGYASNRKSFSNGALLFNGALFGLAEVRGRMADHSLALTVRTAGYFDFLDTCEYLVFEMAYRQKIRRKARFYRWGRLWGLPRRWRQRELRQLDNRFVGIGINNATILYQVETENGRGGTRKEPFLLLHQRSGKVAECFGAISTIPAGSYQPAGLEVRSPFNQNMANTVYREFCEELLGVEEFTHLGDERILDEQYCRWPVLFLGMGFEPVNTKLEVMSAMRIDMDQEDNRQLFGGAHTLAELKAFFHTNYEGNLLLVPFREVTLRQYHQDPRTTPVGREILSILLEHLDYFQQP